MKPNTANRSLTFSQAGRGGIAWRGVGRKSNLCALPQRPCNQGSTWAHLFNRIFVEPDAVPGTENEQDRQDACPDGGEDQKQITDKYTVSDAGSMKKKKAG